MTELVLSFLKELEKNNNREWFQANKGWYDEAKLEVEKLVNTVIPDIARFDPSVNFVTARDCMFRIFRDVRFSKDKAPYKNNFGAWITKAGRKSCGPGYYIHIQPEESLLSAGVYMPDPEKLKKIRQEIYYNIAEFKAILGIKELKKYAGGLDEMDKLKKSPKDFPADFPDLDILKNKHFTISSHLTETQLTEPGFPDFVLKVFNAMHPLNAFLGRAMDG
ncbi:MAG: DUF2461 domain-containing protein [Bacteroidetes bacterium]|nr:MAG: DUF2461 domain-containing protein [Bacteroidota bacterium]